MQERRFAGAIGAPLRVGVDRGVADDVEDDGATPLPRRGREGAEQIERQSEPVAHLIARHPADADPARLRQGFEACRNIDAVAEYVALVDDVVAEVDAYAEFDATLRRHTDVALGHVALD